MDALNFERNQKQNEGATPADFFWFYFKVKTSTFFRFEYLQKLPKIKEYRLKSKWMWAGNVQFFKHVTLCMYGQIHQIFEIRTVGSLVLDKLHILRCLCVSNCAFYYTASSGACKETPNRSWTCLKSFLQRKWSSFESINSKKKKQPPWSGSLLPRGPVTQEASIALNLFCNGN